MGGQSVQCPNCSQNFSCEQHPGETQSPKNRELGKKTKTVIFTIGALLVILAAAFIADKMGPPENTKSESGLASPSQNQSRDKLHTGPTEVVAEYYDIYISGYNDPQSAELGRRLLEARPERLNTPGGQYDKIMVEGADDRLAGRQPRYIRK